MLHPGSRRSGNRTAVSRFSLPELDNPAEIFAFEVRRDSPTVPGRFRPVPAVLRATTWSRQGTEPPGALRSTSAFGQRGQGKGADPKGPRSWGA